MGYASYQEDNLNAMGEPLKQTKKTKAMKEKMPKDEFENKPITQDIAEKTLMQCTEREVGEKTMAYHNRMGSISKSLPREKWRETIRRGFGKYRCESVDFFRS